MSAGEAVFELASLPCRHPRLAMLSAYGPAAIVRLARDPTLLPADMTARPVSVGGLPAARESYEIECGIGWRGVPDQVLEDSEIWPDTKGERVITEEAAIAVMGLVAHALEGAEVRTVLQIGSGGDYLLTIPGGGAVQAECSGIRVDDQGDKLTARLAEKRVQVLTHAEAGVVAVTAFCHPPSQRVVCRLHFVRR